jgi:DNA-binding NarL/FixJ family response regulator
VSEALVRVLVVDDEADLRALIRTLLDLDGRFEVVGEAGDGAAGIEQAAALQPDVVLLDRSMPRMTGLEALPEIRRVAPQAAVMLYTAEDDESLRQAAIASGAVGVMTKDATISALADLLTGALVQSGEDPSRPLSVTVGPVPADAALTWIDNTTKIVEAVRANPGLTDREIEPEIFDLFCQYLASWREVAEGEQEFLWRATAAPDHVSHLLEAWASIDRIDEDRLRELGHEWSTGRGRLFFNALTSAIVGELERQASLRNLAGRLKEQWTPSA